MEPTIGKTIVTNPADQTSETDRPSRTPQVSPPEQQNDRDNVVDENCEHKEKPDGFVYEYIPTATAVMILIPTTLVYFLVMLDGSIIAVAIPAITSEFNSLLDIGWYGGAYQLASSAFQPLSGKIYTHFSTKWSFLLFFFIFELGSAVCGAAQSSAMLIVGRSIAGWGSSGLANGALTIIAAILPPNRQPIVMGINVGLGQIGIACGPLIGGAFTQCVSWRWCFYINLPCGAVVAAILIFMNIPESKAKSPFLQIIRTAVYDLDLPGFALISPAAVMLFLALQWGGNQHPWDNSVVIGLFIGAVATFATFLAWGHHQGDAAMVPFYMLKQQIIWSASATMFFFMGVLFCANYYLPVYFQAVLDNSAVLSGVHILPTIIAQVILAVTSGSMVQRFGYYLPWITSGTALTAAAYGLLSTLSPSTSVGRWIGYQILFGSGCGAAATGSYIAIQSFVPPAQIPVAMGILIFSQNMGGAVFLVVAETIFSSSLRQQILKDAPGVNADLIIAAGARSIRKVVTGQQLKGVLQAYSTAIDKVMYLGAGIAAAAFIFAWGLEWKDIRKQSQQGNTVAKDSAATVV